jgi:adenosylcobinamide-GDP ribazoletransferase
VKTPASLADAGFRPATPVDELRAAIATLTRVPVRSVRADASGAAAFGLVGSLVGLAGAVPVLLLGARDASSLPAAVLAVVVIAALSGAFHLDGLADTADALVAMGPLASGRARKDPTLGAGGAVALVSIVLLDVACLAALLGSVGSAAVAALVVVAGAGSRACVVGGAFAARKRALGEGMGARFAASVSALAVAVAGVSAAVVGLVAIEVAGPVAPVALVGGTVVGAVLTALVIRARHQLDGDGLGAAVELTFAAILLVSAAAASFAPA